MGQSDKIEKENRDNKVYKASKVVMGLWEVDTCNSMPSSFNNRGSLMDRYVPNKS